MVERRPNPSGLASGAPMVGFGGVYHRAGQRPDPVAQPTLRCASNITPFDLFLQGLDLLLHSLEARMDLERLAEGVQCVLVVADVLHDEAKTRQSPEMPRLAGQDLA